VSKTRINSANRTKLIVENKVKNLLREQDDELMASGRGEISDFYTSHESPRGGLGAQRAIPGSAVLRQ